MGKRLIKYKIFCLTEQAWKKVWLEEGDTPPTVCPVDSAHEVDLDSVSADEIKSDNDVQVTAMPPMASKTFGTSKLYKRVVGQQAALATGSNDIIWTCSFPWVKFMGIEFINGEAGDRVSLYVLDKEASPIYGVPNAVLNQFGFDANMSKDFYKQMSEFDADLYEGLQVKITYTSISDKTVGINYIMNEVKS